MTQEKLAWAAGFFDGEGWSGCYTNPGGSTYLMLAVTQNEEATLHRFAESVYGRGRIRGPIKSYRGPNHHFKFEATRFEDVQAIMASMWKYLSAPKRAQFAEAVKKFRGASHRRGYVN